MAAQGQEITAGREDEGLGSILGNLALMLFTDNLFLAAAESSLLPLIFFSIIFAGMLTTMGSKVHALTGMILQINDAMLSFVLLLMKVAPLGIFCLVTARFGQAQLEGVLLDVVGQTGAYFVTVLAGLGTHVLLTLPLIYWMFTRQPACGRGGGARASRTRTSATSSGSPPAVRLAFEFPDRP